MFAAPAPDNQIIIFNPDSENGNHTISILSPTGKLIRFGEVWPYGNSLQILLSRDVFGLKFSENGEWIAFNSPSENAPPNFLMPGLQVGNLSGQPVYRIGGEFAGVGQHLLMPDNRKVLFLAVTADDVHSANLYIANLDGSQVTQIDNNVFAFQTVEQGKRILCVKTYDYGKPEVSSEIWSIEPDGGQREMLVARRPGMYYFTTP
jgi:Tol biopolymer transport system component